MRPKILYDLFAPVTSLPGVGPRVGGFLERLGVAHVVDLLWRLPTGIIDRSLSPTVAEAPPGAIVTLAITVDEHRPSASRRQPWRVLCHDDSGDLVLVFFHPRPDWLMKVLPEGADRIVSGRVEDYRGQLQMTHPDHIAAPEELEKLRGIEPVWPLTQGLSLKVLGRAMTGALARLPDLPEWLDPGLCQRMGWPAWRDAVRAAHAPDSAAGLDPAIPARARLACDELLASQLALALVRAAWRRSPGRPLSVAGTLRDRALASLPWALTGDQETALAEIIGDMASDHRMLRLLQGDVGSGKTIVATLAMLEVVEAGGQAALMAPTELLARQHHATLAPLAEAAGVSAVLLTGREKGARRQGIVAALESGEAGIVVGTHALFQKDVGFRDLRFAVIDEQHRFGVHQRLTLTRKGQATDVLVMTATPIPRTLLMAAWGDMDISRIAEKPPGRKPVETRVLPIARLDEVTRAVRRAIDGGARVYWVCPLVAESEALDVAAAEQRAAALSTLFGEARIGLVHGRMKGPAKDRVMARFVAGDISVLAATTVIEVGMDVPDATIMVIEHAERFGLAQLHQLRGRVGRGREASTCLLLYAGPLGEAARARLRILRETEDGFRIAEEDLILRGAGEVLGTRQSGLPRFGLVDPVAHAELFEIARDDARLALNRDPDLTGPRGEALRILLYLFERDAAVRYLRSG